MHSFSVARRLITLFVLVWCLGAVGVVTPSFAQDATPLFDAGGDAEEGRQETVVRRRTAPLNFALLESLVDEGTGSVRLNLFSDVSVVATTDRVKRWSASQYSWFGTLTEHRLDQVTIEVDLHADAAFATLTVDGRPYRIERVDGHVYEILEISTNGLQDEVTKDGTGDGADGERDPFRIGDPAKSTPAAPSNVSPLPAADVSAGGPSPALKTWLTGAEVVDILVLYTTQARDSAGTATDMEAAIRSAVNEANRSFQKSGVNARLRLAASRLVTYPETKKNGPSPILRDLTRDANTSGKVANRLRNSYGADIIGLVVGDTRKDKICGLGKLMRRNASSFSDKAYFIVEEGSCMNSNRSFTHEAGHVMGARHDRYVDDTDGSPFDYNHGYVNIKADTSGPVGWRTIMAYNDECAKEVDAKDTSCWRINRWSNPDSTRGGDALGVASGDDAADNVRALNNTVSTVAAYRSPSPIVSGTVTDLATGSGLQDVEIRGALGPITDKSGEYQMFVHWGSVQLRPDKGDYEFTPGPAVTLNNVTSNRTQDFDAGVYHELAGTVYVGSTRQLLSNVELQGAPGSPPPPTPNVGQFSYRLLEGWTGTITPKSEKYTFSPTSRSYSGAGLVSDSTDQDFVASIKTYRISGSVTDNGGIGIPNVTLKGLPNNPTTDAFGDYSISVDHGWTGTVTPTKQGYNFQPASTSYANVDSYISTYYTAEESALADSKWPIAGQNAQRTGAVEVSTVDNNLTWNSPVGGDPTAPVVGSKGNVYVGSTDGALHAFDEHGNPMWTTKSVPGDTIAAAPVVGSAYRFFVPLDNGNLFAYDRSGARIWARYLGGSLRSSPVVASDGTIYVGSDDDSLYAVNPDGTKKWAMGTGGKVRSDPTLGSGGTVYVGSDDGSLYAVRPDGSKKWTFSTGDKIRSSPAVGENGTIYVGSDDDSLYAVSPSGSKKWSFSTGGAVRSSPAIGADGTVYFGSNDGAVYALSSSGAEVWTYVLGSPVESSPAISQANVNSSTGQPGEEVVYVGSDNGSLYALNTGSVSVSNRVRWTHVTQDPIRTSPALSDNGLYFGGNGDRLYNIDGARAGAQSGTGKLQAVAAAIAPTPEELYAINRLVGALRPFGESGWTDPGGCGGGPLIIPSCGGPGARFGGATGFKGVIAGESLRFGAISPWVADDPAALERILSGDSREGLRGDFVRQVEPDQTYLAVLGGFDRPSSYPENPDGRSTALNVFVKEGVRAESTAPDQVQLLAGHFVPDGPEMRLSLLNSDETLGALQYGDFSTYQTLAPGQYTVVLQPTGGDVLKRGTSKRRTFPLDLTGKAGETVSLLATGAYTATDEPPLSIRAVAPDGRMLDLRNREGTLAPGLSDLPGLFEDDLLLGPGDEQAVSFDPRDRYDGLGDSPRDVLQLLPRLSSSTGHLSETLPGGESYELPASALSFLSGPEQVDMVGRPLSEMPDDLANFVASRELLAPTHLARLELAQPDGHYEYWLALREYEGYAVPVASLLTSEALVDTGTRASAILTGFRPVELELPFAPEPGQAFEAVFSVEVEVSPEGVEYAPLTGAPLLLGASGTVAEAGEITVGRATGGPASLAEPFHLRLEQAVLGAEGAEHPVRNRTTVLMNRGEQRHELAALWNGQASEAGDVTIEQAQVHSVGRPEGLAASASTILEIDRRVDFGDTGVDIAFEGVERGGSVTVEKYDNAPTGFDGIDAGNVSTYRYVVEADEDLSFATGTLRLDVGSLSGIREPRTVTVYRRPEVGGGTFRSLATTYDAETDELVASTDRFSEFALASTSSPLPVELTRFAARTDEGDVVLQWRTASETDNSGFVVQRRAGSSGEWSRIAFVPGSGTTEQSTRYRHRDTEVPYEATELHYRLRQLDASGTSTRSKAVQVSLSAPERLVLHGSFPNPTDERTTLRYEVAEQDRVRLALYNVLGQRVATIVDERQPPGRRETTFDAGSLASGVYFLRLESGGVVETKKMTVVR